MAGGWARSPRRVLVPSSSWATVWATSVEPDPGQGILQECRQRIMPCVTHDIGAGVSAWGGRENLGQASVKFMENPLCQMSQVVL